MASRYAHSSCARMTREAKTGYTTSLTSVTSPNSWTTYRAHSTGYSHNFFRGFSFLSIFRVSGKTFVIRVEVIGIVLIKLRRLAGIHPISQPRPERERKDERAWERGCSSHTWYSLVFSFVIHIPTCKYEAGILVQFV